MLGSVEAGLKVIMRLEEGKNAEVDFARCSPQAAVVCLHNAPLLGPSINRQGWEIELKSRIFERRFKARRYKSILSAEVNAGSDVLDG